MIPFALAALAGAVTWWSTASWCRPPARSVDTVSTHPSDHRGVTRRAAARSVVPHAFTVSRSTALATALGIVAATLLTLRAPGLALVMALAAPIAMRLARTRQSARRDCLRRAALPELIDALIALVHAGLTPPTAWRELHQCCPDPLRPAVRAVDARMTAGLTFADALGGLVDDLGAPAAALVDALVTTERYGLPLAPMLDRLAARSAAERRSLADARSRQLPVRLSVPLVVCILPAFVLSTVVPVLIAAVSSLPRP